MGVVVINGQKYDSVTGLQIEESSQMSASVETEAQELLVTQDAPKPRRQSKQERLAEAVAREFADDKLGAEIAQEIIAEVNTHELPDWIDQFIDSGIEKQIETVVQPAWISNYVSGGNPIEIQPIGLEAAAREAAREQTVATAEPVRTAPQHNHRTQQHSSTLNRNFVQKPTYMTQAQAQVNVTHKPVASVAKHPEVRHFTPAETDIEPAITNEGKAEAPFAPIMTRGMEEKLSQYEIAQAAATSSSSDLKNALINEQMNQPVDRKARNKAEKKAARTRRRFAAPTLVTAVLAVLVLGGYFTYVNMPSISVRVAAARAGVDAHAPYVPSGYSIDGPVAYTSGSVTINYKSNGGGDGYSLIQQNNTWGDNVVLDNLVENDNYQILKAGQVTVYRYGNTAAWVDRGILFTLSGNDSLGDSQIARIAESV